MVDIEGLVRPVQPSSENFNEPQGRMGKASDGHRMVKIKILIVDDSPVARHALKSILSQHQDMDVAGEAASAAEALLEVPRLNTDVVVVDAQMPEMGGVEATRRIKERWPDTKVLFLAVHSSYIEEATAAGADYCLMKDCSRQDLLRAITELARRD